MDDGTARESTLRKPGACIGRYAGTYAALLALATLSFFLSRARVGGPPVALLIAATKAVLVLWFFMHLADQRASSRIAILVAALMISLLVGLPRSTSPAATHFPPPECHRRPPDTSRDEWVLFSGYTWPHIRANLVNNWVMDVPDGVIPGHGKGLWGGGRVFHE